MYKLRSMFVLIIVLQVVPAVAQTATDVALWPAANKVVRVQWTPRWKSPTSSSGSFLANAMTTDAKGNLFVEHARFEVAAASGLLMFYYLDESAAKIVCAKYSLINNIVPPLELKASPLRRANGANIVHCASD